MLGITLWERVDRLCTTGILSKEGAKNLKLALSNVMELYVRTGEKKVVDIGTAIKEYNDQNPPYDSDEEDNDGGDDDVQQNKKPADHEDEDGDNNYSSFEMEEEEGGAADSTNQSSKKNKQKTDQIFILKNSDVEQIAQIYLVLIPLHNAMKEWINEELKNQDKATLKNSDLFSGTNSTLAEVYLRLCHYEKAKYYYRAAISSESENYQLLNSFGVMWNKLGNYKKAIKYFEKAVVIIEKEIGEDAPQLATQFNNLAMANVNLEQNIQAIHWLERALGADIKVYGESHPYVARDYKNIGLMALKENQFEKALDYLQRGLTIDREHYGEVSSQVAGYYNDIARVYQGLNDFPSAIEFFEKALQVDKQLYATANAIIASRYLSLAIIYQKLKKFDVSLSFYDKALEIYSQVHGDDHLTVATTLYSTAIICVELDQLEKALEYLTRSYSSFKKINGENHDDTQTAFKKMKEIEELLRQRKLYGDDYEKWKLIEEENRRKAQEQQSAFMELEDGGVEDNDEVEYVGPKIYGPDSVQQCSLSVFDDDFYEL